MGTVWSSAFGTLFSARDTLFSSRGESRAGSEPASPAAEPGSGAWERERRPPASTRLCADRGPGGARRAGAVLCESAAAAAAADSHSTAPARRAPPGPRSAHSRVDAGGRRSRSHAPDPGSAAGLAGSLPALDSPREEKSVSRAEKSVPKAELQTVPTGLSSSRPPAQPPRGIEGWKYWSRAGPPSNFVRSTPCRLNL